MKRIRRLSVFTVWLFCLAVLAIFGRCTFKKPVTPSWNVRFQLPLFDSTYTMQALAEHNQNQLAIDPVSDNILLKIDKGPESFAVGKYLTAKAVTNPDQFDFTGLGTIGSKQTINDTLIMENTILVQQAVFEKGSVEFEFNNQTGFTMNLHSTVYSLKRNNQPIQVEFPTVPPGTSRQSVDLENVHFEPLISNDHKNLVPYTGTMSIDYGIPTGSSIVTVNVNLKGVTYQSVTGWLNRTEVAIDTTVDTGIKVSDVFQGIQIGSATLMMSLVNNIRFPATFDLTLTGYAEDGRSETVQIPPESVGASDSIVTNSVDVARIANLLPKTLRLMGKAFLGGGFSGSPSSIHKDDLVKASIHFEAPLIFTLPPNTNRAKVDTIEMKEDAREKIRKNVLDAMLVIEVENHVPLGFRLDLYFSNTRGDSTLYDNHYQLARHLSISRPDDISGTPGVVRRPSVSVDTLSLTKNMNQNDLAVFDSPQVYLGLQFTFPGTGGMVKVRPEDYIRVRTRIEATVNTDFEKEDQQKGGGS